MIERDENGMRTDGGPHMKWRLKPWTYETVPKSSAIWICGKLRGDWHLVDIIIEYVVKDPERSDRIQYCGDMSSGGLGTMDMWGKRKMWSWEVLAKFFFWSPDRGTPLPCGEEVADGD